MPDIGRSATRTALGAVERREEGKGTAAIGEAVRRAHRGRRMGMAVKGSRWPPKRRRVLSGRVTRVRGCKAVRGRYGDDSAVVRVTPPGRVFRWDASRHDWTPVTLPVTGVRAI